MIESIASREHRYDLLRANGDFPKWDGPPMRSFLVCTTYRSGSNLLAEALLDLEGFGCPLDYFDEGLRLGLKRRWQTVSLSDYVAALYRCRTDPQGALGVKIDWPRALSISIEQNPTLAPLRQVNILTAPEENEAVNQAVWQTLQSIFPNPRFIHLTRQDKLRQAVSWMRAKQTRRYWGIDSAALPTDTEAHYDYDLITHTIAGFSYSEVCMNRLFAWAGIEPVRVVYEKFIADYTGTVQRVAEQLDGRRNITVRPPRLQRQSDAVSEEWIKRFLEEHQEQEPE